MANIIDRLRGTIETTFGLGLGTNRVQLKNSTGVMEARNNADDGYVVLRAGTAAADNDVINRKQGDIRYIHAAEYSADSMVTPNANWTVTVPAALSADDNDWGLSVRLFDDTTEEGVGLYSYCPANATNIALDFVSRAITAPGAATTVDVRAYGRTVAANGSKPSWSSAKTLTDIDIPTSELFQYDSEAAFAIGDLGLVAGEWGMIEITRVTGGLTGDWGLAFVRVRYT